MSYTPFVRIPIFLENDDGEGNSYTEVEDILLRTSRIECIEPVMDLTLRRVECRIALFSGKEYCSPLSPSEVEKLMSDE